MKRDSEKDYYAILGLNLNATQEEIREAYLARTRIIHPDRFDRQRQPNDWKKANEMLSELNEAYSVLRDPEKRNTYDKTKESVHKQYESTHPPNRHSQSPPPFEHGELTSGYAIYSELPKNVQEHLQKRQRNEVEDQFQVKMASVILKYVYLVILFGWFIYLLLSASGARWSNDTILIHSGITLVVGILISRNVITIWRWMKSRLKSFLYLTPIYVIKTEYDIVYFRPIWSIKDVAITHNHKNGIYQDTDIVLKFDGYDEYFTLSSKNSVEMFFARLQRYDKALREAYAKGDFRYFQKYDDFYHIPRSVVNHKELISKSQKAFVYCIIFFFSTIGLYIAKNINTEIYENAWFRHSSPRSAINNLENNTSHQRQGLSNVDIQPLSPLSGNRPSYPDISNISKSDVEPVPSYPELPLPPNGGVIPDYTDEWIAPFEIDATQAEHHLVKLVDQNTKEEVLRVFVHGGKKADIRVPLGIYEIRYASGEKWYGNEYLFGPDTAYCKAEEVFTFEVENGRANGYTITLYKVYNGNLYTSPLQPEEF